MTENIRCPLLPRSMRFVGSNNGIEVKYVINPSSMKVKFNRNVYHRVTVGLELDNIDGICGIL